ncbi:N/A [soil metagenome]
MDRRRHYLDTALDLFAADGFHGVSMDRLVAEAGGSKATLYRYFASKEELFEAIIVDLTEVTVEQRSAGALDALSLEEGLRAIGHATARAALSEQATVLFRLATGELNRFPQLAQVLFQHGPAVSYARLRDFLAARVAAGELEVDDLQITAEQFLCGIVGHQQLRRALGQDPPDPSAITARVEAAIATLLTVHRPPSAP